MTAPRIVLLSNAASLSAMHALLTHEGYRILRCRPQDVTDAHAVVKRAQADLVILDLWVAKRGTAGRSSHAWVPTARRCTSRRSSPPGSRTCRRVRPRCCRRCAAMSSPSRSTTRSCCARSRRRLAPHQCARIGVPQCISLHIPIHPCRRCLAAPLLRWRTRPYEIIPPPSLFSCGDGGATAPPPLSSLIRCGGHRDVTPGPVGLLTVSKRRTMSNARRTSSSVARIVRSIKI